MNQDFYKVGDRFKMLNGDYVTVTSIEIGDPNYPVKVKYSSTAKGNGSRTFMGKTYTNMNYDTDLDLYSKNYHLKEVQSILGCPVGMDKEQLELFTNNIFNSVSAIQQVGGEASVVKEHIQFIETCSRNGLKISFEVVDK